MPEPAVWFKTSRCNGKGGNACVEVAHIGGVILVRDGKLGPESAVLTFDLGEWRRFIAGAKAGEFDR